MTSKNLLFSCIRHKLGQSIWLTVLWSIVLFFMFPVAVSLIDVSNFGSYHDTPLNHPVYDLLGTNNFVLLILSVLLAVVTALVLFHYANKKKQVDFFHAQPIKRSLLFWSNYLAGLILFFVPYLFFGAIGTFLAFCRLSAVRVSLDLPLVLIAFGLTCLCFWVFYSISVLACTLCGNAAVALLVTAAFFFYLPAIASCAEAIIRLFYVTLYNSSYYYGSHIDFRYFPLIHFFELTTDSYDGFVSWGWIVFYAIFALATAGVAYLAHCKRSSEAAGQAIAFRAFRPVLKFMLVLVLALASGLMFYSIGNSYFGWMAFGIIVLGFLAHGILNTILHFDLKAFVKGWKSLLIFYLVLALGFGGLTMSANSFNTAVIYEEEVASFSIDNLYTNINWYSTDGSSNMMETTLSAPENIKAAVALQNFAADYIKDKWVRFAPLMHYYAYNENEATNRPHLFSVVFRSENGREFARTYSIPQNEFFRLTGPILSSGEYLAKTVIDPLQEFKKSTESKSINLHINNGYSTTVTIDDRDTQNGLVDAILADALANPGVNIFANNQREIYRLSFFSFPSVPSATGEISFHGEFSFFIGDNFPTTMQFLEERGLLSVEALLDEGLAYQDKLAVQ